MTRDMFVAKMTSFIIQQSNRWLPEESTEEFMFRILMDRLSEHQKSIVQGVLKEDS